MSHDAPDQAPFHVITNKDIWNSLQEVIKNQSDWKASLETITAEQKTQSEKVRALELKFYGVVAGIIGALGLVAMALFTGGTS